MKTKSAFYRLFLFGLLLTTLFNCKKEATKTAPTITISVVTNITATSATFGGEVTSDGGATVTAKGICYGTKQNPTTTDSKTSNGSGTGSFSSSITGLNPGSTYYARAYATNSVETAYSSQATFTTVALSPILTTTDLSVITTTTASSGGNITNDGGSAVTERGVCWSTTQNPTTANSKTIDGTGAGIFTSSLTGLLPGTTYYVKAYATNSIGTTYGNQVTLTTTAVAPFLTTTAVSAIASTTATSGGSITSDGGSTVTVRGVCWATTQNPTIANSKTTDGTGTGTFTSSPAGLTGNTTYYLRAFATNSAGTSYGNEVSFTTLTNAITFNPNLTYGTLSDIDGNIYKTITIGTQTWMAENLKTTKYRNGDQIPKVTDNATWVSINYGAMCYLNNDEINNKNIYGALYNWYSVTDMRNIAPLGWHVATDSEWTTLVTFLGGLTLAPDKLRESGINHWINLNPCSTNNTGFTALPNGGRTNGSGIFEGVSGAGGYWWTSTANGGYGWSRYLSSVCGSIIGVNFIETRCGLGVRCVKD